MSSPAPRLVPAPAASAGSRAVRAWRAWIGFGLRVADFQSRIVLAWVYFALVAPLGLLVRLVSDPLRSRRGKAASYWVPRPQHDPAADARRQF